jgi:hypothetical protein
MPAPKNQELGTKSPFQLRGGINFPNWNGINKQNDQGAIRDTQFRDAINVRIAGNEISARGGQEDAFDSTLDGCVYGMIDVEGEEGIYYTPVNDGFLYQILGGTQTTLIDPTTAPIDLIAGSIYDDTAPRRNLFPLRGEIYVSGLDDDTLTEGFYKLSLQDNGTATLTLEQPLEDICSMTIIQEFGEDVAYVGTTGGDIYRWDTTSFVLDGTGIGTNRLIMFTYFGNVYAAHSGGVSRRNSSGDWSTSFAYPGGAPAGFFPVAATEFKNVAIIYGNGAGPGFSASALSFNGTTITVSETDGTSGADVAVWNGNLYVDHLSAADDDTTEIRQFDGSSWTSFVTQEADTTSRVGAMLVIGGDLYWWTLVGSAVGGADGELVLIRQTDPSNGAFWTLEYETGDVYVDGPPDMSVLNG